MELSIIFVLITMVLPAMSLNQFGGQHLVLAAYNVGVFIVMQGHYFSPFHLLFLSN